MKGEKSDFLQWKFDFEEQLKQRNQKNKERIRK